MLSPNSPIYGNLSHATGKAMLDLQRSITKSLKVHSTELAISEGNSGDASYLARLSSLSDNRKVESENLQNLVSFGVTDNLFDDFQFVNTKFENTQHVIDSLDKSQNLFVIDKDIDYSLLISIPIILGLVIFGYFLYRKSHVTSTLEILTVPPSINYIENTISMIQSSRSLFDDGSPKYAFEKFSQAIRYLYNKYLR